MEKRIRVSTQGRITIPKIIRERANVQDGQPIIVRTVPDKREIIIEILSTMADFK
jgi:AbrB family looped-hinge helix DNA binding protein